MALSSLLSLLHPHQFQSTPLIEEKSITQPDRAPQEFEHLWEAKFQKEIRRRMAREREK